MPPDSSREGLEHASILHRSDLDVLARQLRQEGYTLIGPALKDSTVVLDIITDLAPVPEAHTAPGAVRIHPEAAETIFPCSIGPLSVRRWLNPPREALFTATRDGDRFRAVPADTGPPPAYAFVGIHPCDVAALDRLDRALAADPLYMERRRRVFIAAVTCSHPLSTCFCTSVGVDPGAAPGCDLLITELLRGERRFLVRAESPRGRQVLAVVPQTAATPDDLKEAECLNETARAALVREDLAHRPYAFYEHMEDPVWERIAERCFACGNCTMVCPTCFCTTVEDATSLDGKTATRSRLQDSCFSQSFSYIHGGSVRQSCASRYRQWLLHKFAYFEEQFGAPGCTGCGRCTAWCPAGIDLAAEARGILEA